MKNKLSRTKGSERMFLGVCGGIAKFFGIDPTLVRLAFAIFSFFAFSGVVVYIICAFIVPEESDCINGEYEVKNDNQHWN